MMHTSESWHRYNPSTQFGVALCFTTYRRFLHQNRMCSVVSVVTGVLFHLAFQMSFIDTDYVVRQISAAVSDLTLRDTVLPWSSEMGPLLRDVNFDVLRGPWPAYFSPSPHGSICFGAFGFNPSPVHATKG